MVARGAELFSIVCNGLTGSTMNGDPTLPDNCSFDPGDWQILARHWYPIAPCADVGGAPGDDRLLIGLDRAGLLRGDERRADIREVGAHRLGREEQPPRAGGVSLEWVQPWRN